MTITYIKGDLFATDVKLMAHGCNALGVMGAGVARIVRTRYPEAEAAYIKAIDGGELKLGGVQFVPTKGKIIANAITQQNTGPGLQVSYNAVRKSMKEIKKYMLANNLTKIAMPKIGAGLAGGDWDIISKIIDDELRGKEVIIYYIEDTP